MKTLIVASVVVGAVFFGFFSLTELTVYNPRQDLWGAATAASFMISGFFFNTLMEK